MLAAAAQSGDAALVNSVLRRPGVHVDEPDAQGWRAVHHAAVLNSAEIVHGLVSAGADVNAVQLSRTSAPTALHVAASSGCPDALAALLGAGASVDLTEEGTKGFSKTALHRACETKARYDHGFEMKAKYSKCVELLIAAGADVNKTLEDEETALFRAALYGNAAICRTLLRAGARVDHLVPSRGPTKCAGTALLTAVTRSDAETTHVLLVGGASPTLGASPVSVPLVQALIRNDELIARMLLAAGADDHGGVASARAALNASERPASSSPWPYASSRPWLQCLERSLSPKCAACGAESSGFQSTETGVQLRKCTGCVSGVAYCSTACQRAHWKNGPRGHREMCALRRRRP